MRQWPTDGKPGRRRRVRVRVELAALALGAVLLLVALDGLSPQCARELALLLPLFG